MFINSGFENVPCTCISITRKNHETVIQDIDKFEIDSNSKRKANWKTISEQNVLQSISVLKMTLCSKNSGGMPLKAPLTTPMAWVAEPCSKWRGHKCTLKRNYCKILWCDLATVTSQALKYDVIAYTPYEGLNSTILDKTTPL